MRVLKKDKITLKIEFCEEAYKIINEMVNFNDMLNTEKYDIKKDGSYWHIHKSVIDKFLIEVHLMKTNYSPYNLKEQPKGNRKYERSYCYIKDANVKNNKKWNSFIIENLCFQDYNIKIE